MRILIIKLDDSVYEELERRARAEGYAIVSDFVRSLIMKALGYTSEHHVVEKSVGEDHSKRIATLVEKIVAVVERKVQDRINPFTSKIDEVYRRVAELIERIESLEDRVKSLEAKMESISRHEEREETRRERPRRSAMDILREQKVIFESDIAKRIKDRDSFFLKLQREGAKVIEVKGERVALDPEFWNEFVEKVKNIDTNNEEEIRELLDPIEQRLFDKLREAALLYFDGISRRWNLLIE